MIELNREFLEALARLYCERPVIVEESGAVWPYLGEADYVESDRWRIRLHPSLLTTERAQLATIFLHECGHIKAGHVTPTVTNRFLTVDWCAMLLAQDPSNESIAREKAILQGFEAEADAFAAEQLPKLQGYAGDTPIVELMVVQ